MSYKSLFKEFECLVERPEEYLNVNISNPRPYKHKSWIKLTASFYEHMKKQEKLFQLPKPPDALPALHTKGFDIDQIWEQIQLQNNPLLATPDSVSQIQDHNLGFLISKLTAVTNGEICEASSEEEDKSDEEEIPEEADYEDDHFSDNSEDSVRINDLMNKILPKSKHKKGKNDKFEEDDTLFDNYTKGEADEDEQYEDDDDNRLSEEHESKLKSLGDAEDYFESDESGIEESEEAKKKCYLKKNFRKSTVDTRFFNLRESEWIADNDVLAEGLDSEEIDFMQDIESDSGEASEIVYNKFFGEDKKIEDDNSEEYEISEDGDDNVSVIDGEDNENEDGEDNENEDGEDNENKDGEDNENEDGENSEIEDSEENEDTDKEPKSRFELEMEKERAFIHSLEEKNLSEKPWQLLGEVKSANRPENSALEETLEYNVAQRPRPEITEHTTNMIERLIIGRIRASAFNDVERKVKPISDPSSYKKELLLDQTKSKKSLAQIYEEEYLRKESEAQKAIDTSNNRSSRVPTVGVLDEEQERPEHIKIQSLMDEFFHVLNALSNYHYKPKSKSAEVKIVSNLPAITMEEATPVTATDATLLAPQEVLDVKKGDLKSKGERTSTDRKRERRLKKSLQKRKAQQQEKKLKAQLKSVNKEGIVSSSKATLEFVKKAVQKGQVKLLEGQQKSNMSSKTFFKDLQENKSKRNNDDSEIRKSKKQKKGNLSAKNLLL